MCRACRRVDSMLNVLAYVALCQISEANVATRIVDKSAYVLFYRRRANSATSPQGATGATRPPSSTLSPGHTSPAARHATAHGGCPAALTTTGAGDAGTAVTGKDVDAANCPSQGVGVRVAVATGATGSSGCVARHTEGHAPELARSTCSSSPPHSTGVPGEAKSHTSQVVRCSCCAKSWTRRCAL